MAQPFPAPSLRELARPTGVTEGVSPDEWYSVKSSEFRRGDESRPHPRILAGTPMNGKTHPTHKTPKNHPPADKTSSGRVIDIMGAFPGSLPEGAVTPNGRD